MIPPKFVRVHHTARKHQRVVVVAVCISQRNVHFELIPPFRELPPFHLVRIRRNQICSRTGLFQRAARFGHFHLLKSIGHENRHFFTVESAIHENLRSLS